MDAPTQYRHRCAKVEVLITTTSIEEIVHHEDDGNGYRSGKGACQVQGVNLHGKAVLKKSLRRAQMALIFAKLELCLVGVDACGSAHHWGRYFESFAHTVKQMAPQFVKLRVMSNSVDAVDVETICDAVRRPDMRLAPSMSIEQQSVLVLH